MRNIKNISTIIVLFFLSLLNLAFCPLLLAAEDDGQIININQNYQIAFTDLGSHYLKVGNIVKVFLNEDEFLYMQVIESSSILSKLGLVQKDTFKTNLKDFQRISVGNAVVKVSDSPEERANENLVKQYPPTTFSIDKPASTDPKKAEQELAYAKNEIENLKKSNKAFKERVDELLTELRAKEAQKCAPLKANDNPKVNVSELKARLEKIQRLINQK